MISNRQLWREFFSGLVFYIGILFAILFLLWVFLPVNYVRDRGLSATGPRIGDVLSPGNVVVLLSNDRQSTMRGCCDTFSVKCIGNSGAIERAAMRTSLDAVNDITHGSARRAQSI